MREYALRRVLMMFPVLFLVSMLIFLLMRMLPGDVGAVILGDQAGREAYEKLRSMLGLDKPVHVQYFTWLGEVLHANMGNSLVSRRPVVEEIRKAVPVSLELAIFTLVFSVLFAIPLGVISAIRRNSVLDLVARVFAVSGISIPGFWIATMFLVFSSIYLRWIPPIKYVGIFDDPVSNLIQFGVPALIGSYRGLGVKARMMRSAMLEVLRQDYIRTAWAKGLRERIVIARHALKNAMIPVITVIGNETIMLLGGLVIIETIFSLPGLGRLLLTSIQHRDYPMVQGIVLFTAVVVVSINLIVDLTYAWFDPRIRYG